MINIENLCVVERLYVVREAHAYESFICMEKHPTLTASAFLRIFSATLTSGTTSSGEGTSSRFFFSSSFSCRGNINPWVKHAPRKTRTFTQKTKVSHSEIILSSLIVDRLSSLVPRVSYFLWSNNHRIKRYVPCSFAVLEKFIRRYSSGTMCRFCLALCTVDAAANYRPPWEL